MRGTLSPFEYKLQASIDAIIHGKMHEDKVVVPEGTQLEDAWWQFPYSEPQRIVECEKDQLLRIIEVLMKELEKK